MMLTGENQSTRRETSSGATLTATFHTCIGLGPPQLTLVLT
jgi:hypothetical protein